MLKDLLSNPLVIRLGKLACLAATASIAIAPPHTVAHRIAFEVIGICTVLGWNVPSGDHHSLR
jgi:hypothetical protein